MPTIFFRFELRFYFVSFDCSEPCHMHVGDDAKKICKFWLRNGEVYLADNRGFKKSELAKIQKEIELNYTLMGISKNLPFPLQSICKMLIWRGIQGEVEKKKRVFRDALIHSTFNEYCKEYKK